MYGLVKVTYWSAPTVDLYRNGSGIFSSSCLLSMQVLNIGVLTPFAYDMFTLHNISLIYLV